MAHRSDFRYLHQWPIEVIFTACIINPLEVIFVIIAHRSGFYLFISLAHKSYFLYLYYFAIMNSFPPPSIQICFQLVDKSQPF